MENRKEWKRQSLIIIAEAEKELALAKETCRAAI